MNAKTNLFHPNTHLEFMEDYLKISVSLCIPIEVYLLLRQKGRRCSITRHRCIVSLIFATKDYSRGNIIRIQAFLLTQLMKLIREAKKELLEQSINTLSNKLDEEVINNYKQLTLFQ